MISNYLEVFVLYADCKKTIQGKEYMGTMSVTRSGRQCQHWSSDTPQSVYSGYRMDWKYPNGSFVAAENYCRNPSTYAEYLWCYTTDPHMRWEECDIPKCDSKSAGDCTVSVKKSPWGFLTFFPNGWEF